MEKVHTFTIYKLGNYESVKRLRMYSFQGLSMTILGREDINFWKGRQR